MLNTGNLILTNTKGQIRIAATNYIIGQSSTSESESHRPLLTPAILKQLPIPLFSFLNSKTLHTTHIEYIWISQ
jgi:hypothetical protein